MQTSVFLHVLTSQILKIAVTVIAVAGFLVFARTTAGIWHASSPEFSPTRVNGIEPLQARQRIASELVTLRRTGFEPGEITRPSGRFLLMIENRSGTNEIQLLLRQVSGPTPQGGATFEK